MTVLEDTYRFSAEGFIRAWEAGAFGDTRVELIDGAVVPVVIGDWHMCVSGELIRRLPDGDGHWKIGPGTLVASDSLPDPDCIVRRRSATPTAKMGTRLSAWAPEDIGLIVEVSDESLVIDLNVKTRLCGAEGYQE